MVFWVAILIGVLFAWLAVRLGFYETWILSFNIVVSIYVAIFLAPLVLDFAPATGLGAAYGTALSLLVLAGGCFAILQGMSYVFLTGQFKIPFPRAFDILVAGLLGFGAGFLVLSFVALILTTTPLAEHEIVSTIGFSRESQSPNITCIVRCCNVVDAVVSGGSGNRGAAAAVRRLFEASGTRTGRAEGPADVNEPPAPLRPPAQPPTQ